MTSGLPLVTVPVLSNTTTFTSFKVWMASPERIRIPCSAPMPLPTIRAVGVARPRAQGQAMTSTATVDTMASVATPRSGFTHGRKVPPMTREAIAFGRTSQAVRVSRAMAMTTGTKMAVTRSAKAWMGTFEPWASSTSLITWARKVSLPTRVARTRSSPSWLTVAPMTSSSGCLLTGIDSPVAIDSSTALSPSTTMPSVGTFSPGRTTMTSPTWTCAMAISTSCPSRRTRAVFAPNSSSLRMAWEARPLAVSSTYRPVRWKAMIMAETPA